MKNLHNFIFHLSNFFPKEFCDKIINLSNNIGWNEHTWQSQRYNALKLYSQKELDICDLKNLESPLRNELFFRTMTAIDEYQMINQTSVGVSYIHDYRVNRYQQNTTMRQHVDHIHDLFDGTRRGIPILSIVVNLNENYEGGNLIFFDSVQYSLKTGDIVIFPSNFLYPHSVSEVTSGIRYSMVSWGY